MIQLEVAFALSNAADGTDRRAAYDFSNPIGFRARLDCAAIMECVPQDEAGHWGRGHFLDACRDDMLRFAADVGADLTEDQRSILLTREIGDDGNDRFRRSVLSMSDATALSGFVARWWAERIEDVQWDFMERRGNDQRLRKAGKMSSFESHYD